MTHGKREYVCEKSQAKIPFEERRVVYRRVGAPARARARTDSTRLDNHTKAVGAQLGACLWVTRRECAHADGRSDDNDATSPGRVK